MTRNAWLPGAPGAFDGALTVYCFPYAGGGAPTYRDWVLAGRDTPIRYQPVELPGRASRMAEPVIEDLHSLACAFLDGCLSELAKGPFAFFGHSMGGMICAYLADLLPKQGLAGPVHLFVSGAAPALERSESPAVALDDEALIAKLRGLNGTPEEVLRNRPLMDVLLPALRGDFALIDSHPAGPPNPVRSSLTVFSGSADHLAPARRVDQWSSLATQTFRHVKLAGDHFFLHTQGARIRQEIASDLGRCGPQH